MAGKNGRDSDTPAETPGHSDLAAKDEMFRLMVESVNDYAIFMLDPKGRVISWNPGAERIKGYRAEEIIGRHFSTFYTEDDVKARLPQRELQTATSHGRMQIEGWRLRKDGSRFWAEVIITALHDKQGKLQGFCKVVRDITERRMAEESLQKSRKMFERFFENGPDPVVVVDSRGVIRKINQQAESFFGYLREELVGHRVEILIPERYHQRHRQHRKGYFADPRTRKMGAGLELWGRNRDGREMPVDIMLSPIETDEGVWVFAAIRDITQTRQYEAKITALNATLNSQVEQLAATNRELETFSYSASHDLRAPLRALDGISLALLEDYSAKFDRTGRDYLNRIRAAAQTMGELIDHLLALSRFTRTEIQVSEVDLSAMALKIAEELKEQTPERQVHFIISEGLNDFGDPQLLRVVLANLLANSWKFTSGRRDAQIEFGLLPNQEEHIYFVRDNGAGFDQVYAGNLFKPFQRLHGTGEFPGTGIGLATVQRIIARHGGRIWAEGEVGAGATFYFTLGSRWKEPSESPP